jgi:hypothetical protein
LKAQLFQSVTLTSIAADSGKAKDLAVKSLEENMKEEGFKIYVEGDKLSIVGQIMDPKGRIGLKTQEMVKRTVDLNHHYQNQMQSNTPKAVKFNDLAAVK